MSNIPMRPDLGSAWSGGGGRVGGAGPVKVIGAGPAGLACAIALARAGWQVVVREWHDRVASRSHGDFQGLENWSDKRDVLDELRQSGIEADFDHHDVSQVTVLDDRRLPYRICGARPLYYLARRGAVDGTLDTALLQQAIAAGAEVRFGDRAGRADGLAVLAAGPCVADAIAAGYVLETDMQDGCWAVLDDRLAPLGYAYLLVHGGRETVASCMFAGFKQQAEHVERTVAYFCEIAGPTMRSPRPFSGFANFRLPRSAVQGSHPVVGEQAGFQDAFAGFGMRYALRSGVLAARSILEGIDYPTLWRRELLPLLRVGVVKRFMFNVLGRPGRRFFAQPNSGIQCRHRTPQAVLADPDQSAAVSIGALPLSRAAARPQLRPSRMQLCLVPVPQRVGDGLN